MVLGINVGDSIESVQSITPVSPVSISSSGLRAYLSGSSFSMGIKVYGFIIDPETGKLDNL